jgi:ArsR family transcriptional regulator, arsenate/arsenite/antimonite-responsive transcriptional repressor
MQEILSIFKALSDEIRLRILKLLQNGELCVCDIVAALDMSQPKISFHLSTLKDAGLIKDRKEGRWIHYSIDESDLFRRFLILSALEKIAGDDIASDKERLHVFKSEKKARSGVCSCQDNADKFL